MIGHVETGFALGFTVWVFVWGMTVPIRAVLRLLGIIN